MSEVQEVAPAAAQRMQMADSYERRHGMAVTQHLKSCVPVVQRAQDGPFPVRVLVFERREDLVQMEVVGVAHERAQDAVAARLIESELQILRAQVQIGLGARQTEQEVAIREVCQFVAWTWKEMCRGVEFCF